MRSVSSGVPLAALNEIIAELGARLRDSERDAAGDTIEACFAGQIADSRYWPDDAELGRKWLIYRPTADFGGDGSAWCLKALKTTCAAGAVESKDLEASGSRVESWRLSM
jgi:hypothetical protein